MLVLVPRDRSPQLEWRSLAAPLHAQGGVGIPVSSTSSCMTSLQVRDTLGGNLILVRRSGPWLDFRKPIFPAVIAQKLLCRHCCFPDVPTTTIRVQCWVWSLAALPALGSASADRRLPTMGAECDATLRWFEGIVNRPRGGATKKLKYFYR